MIVKYLHERGEVPTGVADGVDSPWMEKKGGCSGPWKIPRYHVLKVLERILDGRTRRIVECEVGEEQQGSSRGKGKADGIFTLRQLVKRNWRYRRIWLWDS